MSLLFSTQDEGGGSFTEQLAFKSYHFLSTIVVFKPQFLLRTHAKRFVRERSLMTSLVFFLALYDLIPTYLVLLYDVSFGGLSWTPYLP